MDSQVELSIQKIPYLGTSFKLFDEFVLFGYSSTEQKKIVSQNAPDYTDSINFPMFDQIERYKVIKHECFPSLLSSISNQDNIIFNQSNVLQKYIFPNPPSIFLAPKNKIIEANKDCIEYNTVFFINCDSNEKDTKTLFYGYAYVFYEEGVVDSYYFPKALCFISRYPFFSHYYDLAKTIRSLFTNVQVPIEFVLHNIINHSIAPVNTSINIEWVPEMFKGYLNINTKGYFDCLSSYPIIDLDYSVLFSIMPLELIIQIFIFSFIEKPMLFFSENIEILNCVLYLFYTMHYPCTDSNYVGHLISLSEKELLNNDLKSRFVSKPSTSMMGVNCSFKADIDTNQFSLDLFIVDLDNRKFLAKRQTKKEYYFQCCSFYSYLNDFLVQQPNPSNFFEENVKLLFNKLEKFKVNNDTETNKRVKFDFFKNNKEITKRNREIQEIFYSFTLNITKPLYFYLPIIKNIKEFQSAREILPQNLVNMIQNNKKLNPENTNEYFFYREVLGGIKSLTYFSDFLHSEKGLSCFLVSYVFSEEFLQMNNTILDEFSVPHFDIIDSFYNINKEAVNLSLCDYTKIIEKEADRTQTMNYISKHLMHRLSPTIELKTSLILLYHSILNDLDEATYSSIFPSPSIKMKYEVIPYNSIAQHIERLMIINKTLNINYVISYCTMVLSLVIFELLTKDNYNQIFDLVLELFLNQIEVVDINTIKPNFLRKNITMYIKVIYNYISKTNNLKIGNQILFDKYHQLLDILVLFENHPNMDLITILKLIDPKDNSNNSETEPVLDEQIVQYIQKKKNGEKGLINAMEAAKPIQKKKNKDYLLLIQDNQCRDGGTREDVIYQKIQGLVDCSNLVFKCITCGKVITPSLELRFRKKTSHPLKIEVYSIVKLYDSAKSLMAEWLNNQYSFSSLNIKAYWALLINVMFCQSRMELKNSMPIISELFY